MQIELEKLRAENRSLRESNSNLKRDNSSLTEERDSLRFALQILAREAKETQISHNDNPSTRSDQPQPPANNNNESTPNSAKKDQWQTAGAKAKKRAGRKQKINPQQGNHDRPDKKPVTVVCGDSMIQNVRGWELSSGSNKVVVKSFPGATISDMEHYLVPPLRKRPENLILHVGTNDIHGSSPDEAAKGVVDLARLVEETSPSTTISISGLIVRKDDKDDKVLQVNRKLKNLCRLNHWSFIDNSNIKLEHLNKGGLHLSHLGSSLLSNNLKSSVDTV